MEEFLRGLAEESVLAAIFVFLWWQNHRELKECIKERAEFKMRWEEHLRNGHGK